MELNGLKMTQLRRICQEKGIKGYSNLKKPKLIELISSHTGSNEAPEGYQYEPPVRSKGKPTKTDILISKSVEPELVATMNLDQINDKVEELKLKDLASKRGVRIKGPKKTREELVTRAKDIGMNYKDSWSDRKLKVTLDYALLSDTDEEDAEDEV